MMQYPVINGSTATYVDGEVVHELIPQCARYYYRRIDEMQQEVNK